MKMEGDGYQVMYDAGLLTLTGKLSLMVEDYEELEAFFESVLETEPSVLTLDIRNLEYLNSSGIKTICVGLLLEADEIENMQVSLVMCHEKNPLQYLSQG